MTESDRPATPTEGAPDGRHPTARQHAPMDVAHELFDDSERGASASDR